MGTSESDMQPQNLRWHKKWKKTMEKKIRDEEMMLHSAQYR